MGGTVNKCGGAGGGTTIINNLGGQSSCYTQEFLVDQADGLPLSATLTSGLLIDSLYVDVDNMTSNFNISAWIPTDLNDCAIVRVRKIDNSPFRIRWDDGVRNYNYVNLRGEFLTFRYDFQANKLQII